MPQSFVCRIAAALALLLLLTGCSVNPIVQWRPVADPPAGMDAALADAQQLRTQFEAKAEQQMGRKLLTNDLLFGLGVASFAAAISTAHKDVLKTTAGLGGATYLYSTTALQQPIFDAYQVGIGRVNCAATIGRALRVDPRAVGDQTRQTEALRQELPVLAGAISDAELQLLGADGIPADYKAAAKSRIASARETLERARAASKDADALGERETGMAGKLMGTLHAIHQAVNEMAAKGVPEPKAVMESLKSLAGLAGDFGKAVGADAAPAASADSTGGPSSQSSGGKNVSSSGVARPNAGVALPNLTAIGQALVQMASAEARVGVLADALAQRAVRHTSDVDVSDMDKCVPDGAKMSTFKLSTSVLNFTANKDDDQSQSFFVSGGATNYTARITSQPTYGISLVSPLAGGNLFDVKVPKTTKGPHDLTILVEDSSSPRNQATLVIKVGEAGKTADAQAAAGGQSASMVQALKAAKDSGASMTFGTSRLTISTWYLDPNGLRVELACQAGAKPVPIVNKEVRSKLLDLLRDGFQLAPDAADAMRKAPAKFSVAAVPATCIQ